MNERWISHDKSYKVNLYMIKQMLHYESVNKAENVMKESYPMDIKYNYREYRNLTFGDYVNKRRQVIASILGLPQYF